jgi:tRNA-splicing ligase RtcB (3'-phosphate/5'-hydroxy nucleic acid ligase)
MLTITNRFEIPTMLFANPKVHLERKAIHKLVQLGEYPADARLERVVLTPDFHQASPIHVGMVLHTKGFALPQAIGNDVNCGMRLHTTGWCSADLMAQQNPIVQRLRQLFFGAGRNIPMTGMQRQAMLQYGLLGLLESVPKSQTQGLWRSWQQHLDLERTEHCGSILTQSILYLFAKRQPRRGAVTPEVKQCVNTT